MREPDVAWMRRALALAEQSKTAGEVPVGAVLVRGDDCIAEAHNQPIRLHDPSAHAEILALRRGAEVLRNYRLSNTTLYVTLEPCVMCIGAILHARVERLVFGARDPRAGAVCSVFEVPAEQRLNHRLAWVGDVLAEESAALLRGFFQERR